MQYKRNQTYDRKNAIKNFLSVVMDTIDFSRYHPAAGLRRRAHETSVDFLLRNAPGAIAFTSPKELLRFALTKADSNFGAFAEFGVYQAASLNYIAKQVEPEVVFGFDSFEGLPADWHNMSKDFFSLRGKLPRVRDNVKLVKGFFDDSLPAFFEKHSTRFCFVHIDCDVYISTQSVLKNIAGRIGPGTIILFDDYLNQPFWENDSHKAFQEACMTYGWRVEYLGFSYQELLVRLVEK